jgi:diguanylate cyclase (GGDEF)-like protein
MDHRRAAALHSSLIVVTGAQFGEAFDLVPGRTLTLGRGPDAAALLDDETLAERHAEVTVEGGDALLVDLGSRAGTFVNGVRVQEARLENGARFWVGQHTALKFVAAADAEAVYQRALARGARHEPLTGLYNRRHFRERFAAEVAAAQRHGRALSLLAVDVDALRRVNETHGPLAGDEALKMVAFVLQGAIRKEDVVARVAGERFLILARETGLTGATALAERIRRAVERSRSSFPGEEVGATVHIGVTVSIGVACFGPGRTEDHMLAAADAMLQKAKDRGGNGVAAEEAAGPEAI